MFTKVRSPLPLHRLIGAKKIEQVINEYLQLFMVCWKGGGLVLLNIIVMLTLTVSQSQASQDYLLGEATILVGKGRKSSGDFNQIASLQYICLGLYYAQLNIKALIEEHLVKMSLYDCFILFCSKYKTTRKGNK